MKSAALFLLGIFIFLILFYGGLYVAEKGVLELTAFPGPAGALSCELKCDKIIIVFAGNKYCITFAKILRLGLGQPQPSS